MDFSHQMLHKAREKILKNNWENVELIQADVIDFKKAYYSFLSNTKDRGEIIIGDMQLASGWQAQLNPLTLFISKKFGSTAKGHQNSLELKSIMKEELTEVKIREFFMNSYYFYIGKKSMTKPIGR